MNRRGLLVLGGGGAGWHHDQLLSAATVADCGVTFATYESLAGDQDGNVTIEFDRDRVPVDRFDAVLCRTMPAGGLEPITFRLSCLHQIQRRGTAILNTAASMEIAIDKFATLAIAAAIGCSVPATRTVQSRDAAVDAFEELGGDCVVKPIFGGEGRGVMRIRDPELAWTVFSSLQINASVIHVQKFVPPGGRDTRILMVGDKTFAVRRESDADFRTNRRGGSRVHRIAADPCLVEQSRRLCDGIGVRIAAVDWIDSDSGDPVLIEVNAIPGWRSAQTVIDESIAAAMVDTLVAAAES